MKSKFQQEQQRVDSVVEVITGRIHKLEEDTTRQRNEVVQYPQAFLG